MAQATDLGTVELLPAGKLRVREVWVRGTFLSRVWATLVETILHPFTRSVLRFNRPAPRDDTDSEPSE
jgi:hypothetical protein